MSKPRAQTTRVVIVGGGFGGLAAARALAGHRSEKLAVTLVDRRNHHLFQPLLYQVAMAGLNPADIATPIRTAFDRYPNVAVRMGNVTHVDLERRLLSVDSGELEYDYLVLACGATHSYFGHADWEEHAPGLKTLEQATEIRRRVLTAFELAEVESDPKRQRELLTFVVVGGGPTGVELAGALGELSRYTLIRDFRHVDPASTRVLLIEGGSRVLPSFHPTLSRAAARALERLGVTVWTGLRVTRIDASGVQAGDEFVRAQTVLWAAGVQASDLNRGLGELDGQGRVPVAADLSLPLHREVFVVGDQARFVRDGEALPGVAQVAIQGGRRSAQNILADLNERPREPFRYRDKGMMAAIGRASAVLESGKLRMTGFFAWVVWCFVHILFLIGFRNRLLVFIEWAWSYFRYRRGARLITTPGWKLEDGRRSLPSPEHEERRHEERQEQA